MIVARSRGVINGQFVVGWLLGNRTQERAVSLIDVADDGVEKDCGTRFGCCCQIDMVVCGERGKGVEAFLQDYSIDDDKFQLTLLTSQPLRPEFSPRYPPGHDDRVFLYCENHVVALLRKFCSASDDMLQRFSSTLYKNA